MILAPRQADLGTSSSSRSMAIRGLENMSKRYALFMYILLSLAKIRFLYLQGNTLFWSPEVQEGAYIFTGTSNKFHFSRHYLHDVESIYWLFNYMICSFTPQWLEGVAKFDIDAAQRELLFRCYLPSVSGHREALLRSAGQIPTALLSLSLPNGTWTVGALRGASLTLGKWIMDKHHTDLHPAKHSVTALANPSPPDSRADTLKEILALLDQASDPTYEQLLALPARAECRFSQDRFKDIFPQLRTKLKKLQKGLRFDGIAKMERTWDRSDVCLSSPYALPSPLRM